MKGLSIPLLGVLLVLAATVSAAEKEADAILGKWLTDGNESVVEICKTEDLFHGKIVWLKEPYKSDGSEKIDSENPDESKRGGKIIGLGILSDFKYSGRNRWSSGTVYDPNNGKTYACNIKLKENELYIRGYVGVPAFGRTTVWTRKE